MWFGETPRARTLGGLGNAIPIAPDQRVLLRPAPTLQLALVGDGILDPRALLGPDQGDRTPRAGVAAVGPVAMLAQPPVQRVPASRPDVVAAVRAKQHVDEGGHGIPRPARPVVPDPWDPTIPLILRCCTAASKEASSQPRDP